MNTKTDDFYPNAPGSVAGSATSGDAADSARDFNESLSDQIETWFANSAGLKTCEECERAFSGKHQTISARIRTDLFVKRRSLYKVAIDKNTGQDVRVWEHTDESNLKTDEKDRIVFRTKGTRANRKAVLYGYGYDQGGHEVSDELRRARRLAKARRELRVWVSKHGDLAESADVVEAAKSF
jgi:hypothetical protein